MTSTMTRADRFWAKVNKTATCWLWTASTNGIGYGHFRIGNHKMVYAHRYAYEILVGAIPDGLILDHLCRVRRCCNPAHLRPVTSRENTLARGSLSLAKRKADATSCIHGHPFDAANTHIRRDGHRLCLACRDRRNRQWYLEHKS